MTDEIRVFKVSPGESIHVRTPEQIRAAARARELPTLADRHVRAFDRVLERLTRSNDVLAPVFILLSIVYLLLVLTPHMIVSGWLARRRRRKLARMVVVRACDREVDQ